MDWAKFIIHFVFGVLLAGLIGFWLFRLDDSFIPCTAGLAVVLGLLGGFFGDRFWTGFLGLLRWFV